jgi:hypothetical protein
MSEPKVIRKLGLSADERHIMVEFGLSPGHILWMRAKLLEMGNDWDLFRQSFPLTPGDAWVTPGVQVFPLKQLREQQEHLRTPKRHAEVFPGPRVMDAPQGRLRIWDEPEAGKTYDIGVDVSQGLGKDDKPDTEDELHDFSVACVLERGTNKQVAEWASRAVDSHELATILYWLGMYYNTAQIAVETNGIGGATNSQLGKLGYLNCLVPDHKVLMADMRWVCVGDLQVGDKLVGFDEKPLTPRHLRRYREAEVLGCQSREEVVYRVILSDGTELRCTGEHQWITVLGGGGVQYWRPAERLRVGYGLPRCFTPWSVLRTYDAGWMAALLDGEGSVGQYEQKGRDTHTQLSISQKPGPVLDKACELLRRWGFQFSLCGPSPESGVYHIQVGRKSDIARLLGMMRPVRLLPKLSPEWFRSLRGESHVIVEAVEQLGVQDIVTFGTTTGTYVAEGFPTHNCYAWRYRDELSPRYSKKIGWETSSKSKPWLVSFAVHQLVNGRVIIRSEMLHKEMQQFVRKGEREWGAVAGRKDDMVMAWMIALLTSDDENFERYFGLRKALEGTPQVQAEKKRQPESWECDQTFRKSSRVDLVAPWP